MKENTGERGIEDGLNRIATTFERSRDKNGRRSKRRFQHQLPLL